MPEKFPTNKPASTAASGTHNEGSDEDIMVQKVHDALRPENERRGNPLTGEELLFVARVYAENARKRGQNVDPENIPMDELFAAREEIKKVGIPIVDPGTGDVLHAKDEESVRRTIEQHSKDIREGN
ncbi:MAG: hypothetical protein B7X04_02225 [Parcubacteria group bacterium 21-54-25]|nr:MAG: hypothetical protein B7X04_02225 [Parcubacteria group bacterium 21-54-25]HQU07864.1 hypothetical protein [Candidatus Paceibacterota bacterium]